MSLDESYCYTNARIFNTCVVVRNFIEQLNNNTNFNRANDDLWMIRAASYTLPYFSFRFIQAQSVGTPSCKCYLQPYYRMAYCHVAPGRHRKLPLVDTFCHVTNVAGSPVPLLLAGRGFTLFLYHFLRFSFIFVVWFILKTCRLKKSAKAAAICISVSCWSMTLPCWTMNFDLHL